MEYGFDAEHVRQFSHLARVIAQRHGEMKTVILGLFMKLLRVGDGAVNLQAAARLVVPDTVRNLSLRNWGLGIGVRAPLVVSGVFELVVPTSS